MLLPIKKNISFVIFSFLFFVLLKVQIISAALPVQVAESERSASGELKVREDVKQNALNDSEPNPFNALLSATLLSQDEKQLNIIEMALKNNKKEAVKLLQLLFVHHQTLEAYLAERLRGQASSRSSASDKKKILNDQLRVKEYDNESLVFSLTFSRLLQIEKTILSECDSKTLALWKGFQNYLEENGSFFSFESLKTKFLARQLVAKQALSVLNQFFELHACYSSAQHLKFSLETKTYFNDLVLPKIMIQGTKLFCSLLQVLKSVKVSCSQLVFNDSISLMQTFQSYLEKDFDEKVAEPLSALRKQFSNDNFLEKFNEKIILYKMMRSNFYRDYDFSRRQYNDDDGIEDLFIPLYKEAFFFKTMYSALYLKLLENFESLPLLEYGFLKDESLPPYLFPLHLLEILCKVSGSKGSDAGKENLKYIISSLPKIMSKHDSLPSPVSQKKSIIGKDFMGGLKFWFADRLTMWVSHMKENQPVYFNYSAASVYYKKFLQKQFTFLTEEQSDLNKKKKKKKGAQQFKMPSGSKSRQKEKKKEDKELKSMEKQEVQEELLAEAMEEKLVLQEVHDSEIKQAINLEQAESLKVESRKPNQKHEKWKKTSQELFSYFFNTHQNFDVSSTCTVASYYDTNRHERMWACLNLGDEKKAVKSASEYDDCDFKQLYKEDRFHCIPEYAMRNLHRAGCYTSENDLISINKDLQKPIKLRTKGDVAYFIPARISLTPCVSFLEKIKVGIYDGGYVFIFQGNECYHAMFHQSKISYECNGKD